MGDFFRFETMITPVLIQILFWVIVVVSVISGIVTLVSEGKQEIGRGLFLIILVPIMARIYAEIMIILFRIYEHLRQIEHNTQPA